MKVAGAREASSHNARKDAPKAANGAGGRCNFAAGRGLGDVPLGRSARSSNGYMTKSAVCHERTAPAVTPLPHKMAALTLVVVGGRLGQLARSSLTARHPPDDLSDQPGARGE